jgi:hypothetical protein
MKKLSIMLVLAMALAFTFTSCKNKERCWKITVEAYGEKESAYVWGSENDVEATLADYEKDAKDYGVKLNTSYEKVKKSESDCDDIDLEDIEF